MIIHLIQMLLTSNRGMSNNFLLYKKFFYSCMKFQKRPKPIPKELQKRSRIGKRQERVLI